MVIMRKIGATRFKAECLRILDTLEPEGIIVTKHGKPVAKVTPIKGAPVHLIGILKGKVKVTGDIMSTGIKWDAES